METRESKTYHLESIKRRAADVIERCRQLAKFTDVEGETTRFFLSPAMQRCMNQVQSWMEAAGLSVTVDAAGNLRGLYFAKTADAPRLLVGSHLDTVPNAGAFDGVLGVVLGLALLESLQGERFSYSIELIGFSEEEGVRYRAPFIGSRALVGELTPEMLALEDANGISMRQAIADFHLDAAKLPDAAFDAGSIAYLEFHIEQGLVLERRTASLGVVDWIAGQTRGEVSFIGHASHAGTTPMDMRRDALAAAAEWISEVERQAKASPELLATVGRLDVYPGAENVVAGEARASLDLRHANDEVRRAFVAELLRQAESIAERRGIKARWRLQLDQAAIRMDSRLSEIAAAAVVKTGVEPLRMTSGAGHDAMILAPHLPSTMIFLQSPGGLSHHPDESVRIEDVENALAAGVKFLRDFEMRLPELQTLVKANYE